MNTKIQSQHTFGYCILKSHTIDHAVVALSTSKEKLEVKVDGCEMYLVSQKIITLFSNFEKTNTKDISSASPSIEQHLGASSPFVFSAKISSIVTTYRKLTQKNCEVLSHELETVRGEVNNTGRRYWF